MARLLVVSVAALLASVLVTACSDQSAPANRAAAIVARTAASSGQQATTALQPAAPSPIPIPYPVNATPRDVASGQAAGRRQYRAR